MFRLRDVGNPGTGSIACVEPDSYDGPVYDLEVEEDHSSHEENMYYAGRDMDDWKKMNPVGKQL